MSCVFHAFASIHCCLVVTCWEMVDFLTLLCDVQLFFVTFPYGICVRCGTGLYRFLLFAAFLTFTYIDKYSICPYKTKYVTAFRSLLKTQNAYPSPLSCDPLDVISELNTLSALAHSTLSFLWSTLAP